MRLHLPVERMRLVAAVTLLVLVAGCDTAGPAAVDAPLRSGGVALTADRDAYRSGEIVWLSLVNGASRELTTGVLECAVLERWSGRAWETSRHGNDRACIMMALVVEPGRTVTAGVPVRAPGGSYRLVQHVSVGERGATVATGAFRIG